MLFGPRNSSKNITLGLEFQSDAVAVAIARGKDSELVLLESQGEQKQTPAQRLKDWVTQNHLTKTSCNIVLGTGDYQLALIEPPQVPEDELRQAVRWRLKDLISMPVEQAIVDIFALPQDGTRANKKLTYAVAAARSELEQKIAAAEFAGLNVNAIDIAEMALRNVIYRALPDVDPERGIVVARLTEGAGSIYVYRQHNLYLARNFKLDYKAGALDAIPEESLALELQRSMDYYERQMGQAPPAGVYLCGEQVNDHKIGSVLTASLPVPVKLLSPLLPGAENHLQQCLLAAGGAWRGQAA